MTYVDKNLIVHEPIFVEEAIQDNIDSDLHYVCTSDFVDYYYRPTKHPKFGNHYLAIRHCDYTNRVILSRGDHIEDEVFTMIKDKQNQLHYSSHVHDFVQLEDGTFIDGGRDYVRTNTKYTYRMKVQNGKFTYAL